MSRDLRVRFAELPLRLHVDGGSVPSIEFRVVDAAEAARRSEAAHEAARRATEDRAKRSEFERQQRLDLSVAALAEQARAMRAELDAELVNAESLLAKLAFRVAERAIRKSLEQDPLLLGPAIHDAITRLRADLEDPAVVTVVVAPTDFERLSAAIASSVDGPGAAVAVKVVAEPSFEPGRFEARCDIRRIRHSIATELAAIEADMGLKASET